jgi:hypothetical protein
LFLLNFENALGYLFATKDLDIIVAHASKFAKAYPTYLVVNKS